MLCKPMRKTRFDASTPVIEPMESRLLLAGDVTATITAGGDLLLVGDDLANQIVVDQYGVPI